MTMADKLYEVGSKLPASALVELLDFAQFLEQKNTTSPSAPHTSLAELSGGLEDSTTFAGSPMDIQVKMRREWD